MPMTSCNEIVWEIGMKREVRAGNWRQEIVDRRQGGKRKRKKNKKRQR